MSHGGRGSGDPMSEEPQLATTSACPHPDAIGERWSDLISAERQAELQGVLDTWDTSRADHGVRIGPFDGISLTGADVFWLAERVRNDEFSRSVPDLHLERTRLARTHLEGANLISAHLEGVDLSFAHLEGAHFNEAQLRGANLWQAHLEGAYLTGAYLEGAHLRPAHLERA